jgi:hypothetical protein
MQDRGLLCFKADILNTPENEEEEKVSAKP